MDEDKSNFPLSWPVGWPRRRTRERAKFANRVATEGRSWKSNQRLSLADGRERLLSELEMLGARGVIISSNVPVRLDGLPRSGSAEPSDPAVAVYFKIKGESRVLASDKWDRVADNLAALAAHVGAMRGQIRWGIGSIEQAFRGYTALMAMGAKRPWREVLGLGAEATVADAEAKRIELMQRFHPDKGGSSEQAADINAAVDDARGELATEAA